MKQTVQERIQEASQNVLKLLEEHDLGEIVTKIAFKRLESDKPIDTWSMFNQMSCLSAYLNAHEDESIGTAIDNMDFRGFKQWKATDRFVRKGEHAQGAILTPRMKKETNKSGKDEQKLIGFMAAPVFELQQTDGEPLNSGQDERTEIIHKFDFMDVAAKLGITVIAKPGNGQYHGAFSASHNVIELCTPDESTFYHELAHAVDNKLLHEQHGKGLKGGQHVDQETVAQFSANVLAYMTGKKIQTTTAFTKQYLQSYIKGDVTKGVMELIHRIERIVGFIVESSDTQLPQTGA